LQLGCRPWGGVAIAEFVKAGVVGFTLDDASSSQFLKTIKMVARGEKILPRQLTEPLFSSIANSPANNAPTNLKQLGITKREREVMELISEGLANKEIAERLHLAIYMVKNHVHHILRKLALHTRLQIVSYARVEGISKPIR
jgi:DNA-binding NarL/FixJ family response regulator